MVKSMEMGNLYMLMGHYTPAASKITLKKAKGFKLGPMAEDTKELGIKINNMAKVHFNGMTAANTQATMPII